MRYRITQWVEPPFSLRKDKYNIIDGKTGRFVAHDLTERMAFAMAIVLNTEHHRWMDEHGVRCEVLPVDLRPEIIDT